MEITSEILALEKTFNNTCDGTLGDAFRVARATRYGDKTTIVFKCSKHDSKNRQGDETMHESTAQLTPFLEFFTLFYKLRLAVGRTKGICWILISTFDPLGELNGNTSQKCTFSGH